MSSHHSNSPGHEPDMNPKAVIWVIPLSIILLIGYVVTVWFGATSSLSHEMQKKQSSGAEPLRVEQLEYRAKDEAILSQYQWKEKDKGVVQIPIQRAIELIVHDASISSTPVKKDDATSKPKVKAK